MNGQQSHAWIALFAFSMPMIAFLVAVAIGLGVGPIKEGSAEKEQQTEAPQDTPAE